MRSLVTAFCLILLFPAILVAGSMNDDPLLATVVVDQLEYRLTGGSDPLIWDGEAWMGKDLHKLWIKTTGEYRYGRAEELEAQILYSRGVAPFWDLQLGFRRDIRPGPGRDWVALGVRGLAPYFFDVDAAVFIGDSGRTAARLQVAYEIMLTQRLILEPEVELNLYGQNDPATGTGAGLADMEAGLRLRYEIRRRFAPYLGITWIRLYGDTADFAAAEGAGIESTRLAVGLRTWF